MILYRAWRTLYSVIDYDHMVIRVTFTVIIGLSKGRFPHSLTMERKVLQWNWYLPEVFCDQDVVTKRSTPSHTEETARLPVTHIPKPHTHPPKEAPLHSADELNSQSILENALFTLSQEDTTKSE